MIGFVKRLLSEPLVHFLLAGGVMLLLVGHFVIGPAEPIAGPSTRIRVNAGALKQFVQAKTRIEDPTAFAASFDALSAKAKREWVDGFVREEALVREARRLGLDQQDDLIRRRLVQQIEFVALGLVEAELDFNAQALARTYRERAEDYRVPATLSFSQVFLRRGGDVDTRAQKLLANLNAEGAHAADALGRGDRFLYNRNYVDRTVEEVASHFGAEMVARLVGLDPDPDRWQGPFESDHGVHLILLTRSEASHLPEVEEIRSYLHDDWLRETRDAALDRAVDQIVSGYSIELDDELESLVENERDEVSAEP